MQCPVHLAMRLQCQLSQHLSKMIRTFDSNLERMVSDEFDRVGLEMGSCPEVVPGRPDFVLRGANVAVFVHGCYWHRHLNCVLSDSSGAASTERAKKFARSVERDNEVRRDLRNAGWSVAILWECSLRKDLSSVVRHFIESIETNSANNESSLPWLFVA